MKYRYIYSPKAMERNQKQAESGTKTMKEKKSGVKIPFTDFYSEGTAEPTWHPKNRDLVENGRLI